MCSRAAGPAPAVLAALGVGRDGQVVEGDAVGGRQRRSRCGWRRWPRLRRAAGRCARNSRSFRQWPCLLTMISRRALRRASCGYGSMPNSADSVSRRARIGLDVRRQVEVHAQEEAAGFVVAELLGIRDVAAQFEQQTADAIHDARAVGAGQGQDVVVVLHGLEDAWMEGRSDQAAAGRARVSSARARLDVRPGILPPNRLTRPGTPWSAGPAIMKSAAGSRGPEIFGRMPV